MNSYKILLWVSFLSLFYISNMQAQIDTIVLFYLDEKPVECQKSAWMLERRTARCLWKHTAFQIFLI